MATVDIINSMKEHVQAAYSQVETMKGTVPTKKNLENLAAAIGTVKTGTDTSDATATADDILLGKTAYAKGEKLTGTIETYAGEGGETVNKLASLVDGTLTEITAEDLAGITKIDSYAFTYNNSIEQVTLPDSVKYINIQSFSGCKKLKNITINYGVMQILERCFGDCSELQSLTLPDSITYLGDNICINCSKLSKIVFPNSISNVPMNACYNCTSLVDVKIGESVKNVSTSVFQKCTALSNIVIPANVTNIGSSALIIGGVNNKATITMLPTTPPTIQSSTFKASYLQKIIVPAGTGATYKAATNWSTFADYIEEATA